MRGSDTLSAMDQRLAIGLAIASAVLLAISATIQQRVASQVDVGGRRVDPALLAKLFRRPLWVLGFVLTLGHFSMSATALAKGRLVVVEPILATGLLIALPMSAALHGRRLRRLDWLAAIAAAGGLAAFLVIASPSAGRNIVATVPLLIVVLSLEAAAIVATVLARAAHRLLPVALGAAAGVMAAATDACTKTVAQLAGGHQLGVFGDPRLYLLALAGLTTFTLQQNAYRSAGLAASLPAVAVLQPTMGALLGVVIYDEVLRSGAAYLGGETVAALIAGWGVITLARSPLVQAGMLTQVRPKTAAESAPLDPASPR